MHYILSIKSEIYLLGKFKKKKKKKYSTSVVLCSFITAILTPLVFSDSVAENPPNNMVSLSPMTVLESYKRNSKMDLQH